MSTGMIVFLVWYLSGLAAAIYCTYRDYEDGCVITTKDIIICLLTAFFGPLLVIGVLWDDTIVLFQKKDNKHV